MRGPLPDRSAEPSATGVAAHRPGERRLLSGHFQERFCVPFLNQTVGSLLGPWVPGVLSAELPRAQGQMPGRGADEKRVGGLGGGLGFRIRAPGILRRAGERVSSRLTRGERRGRAVFRGRRPGVFSAWDAACDRVCVWMEALQLQMTGANLSGRGEGRTRSPPATSCCPRPPPRRKTARRSLRPFLSFLRGSQGNCGCMLRGREEAVPFFAPEVVI